MSAPSSARAVLREPFVPLVLAASQVGRLPLRAAPLALLLFARQSSSLAAAGPPVARFPAGSRRNVPGAALHDQRHLDRARQVGQAPGGHRGERVAQPHRRAGPVAPPSVGHGTDDVGPVDDHQGYGHKG